jgi:hypothetical protein
VSSDTAPADSYVLMGPAEYSANPVPTGVIPVAYFKSYEDFYSAVYQVDDSSVSAYGATVVPAIPSGFKWVAYDPEQWGWKGSNPADWTPGSEPTTKTLDSSSPPTYTYSGGYGELGDPTTAMAAFIELAHSFGYHVMVMPSDDLTYYTSTDGTGAGAVNDYLYDTWAPVPNPVVADGEYQSNDPAPWPVQTGRSSRPEPPPTCTRSRPRRTRARATTSTSSPAGTATTTTSTSPRRPPARSTRPRPPAVRP